MSKAGTHRHAFTVHKFPAADSQKVGQHSACYFLCAMLLLMGCATVLLAQLRTSPSFAMPADAIGRASPLCMRLG